MCGRFVVVISDAELREIVAAAEKSVREHDERQRTLFQGGEIFPDDSAPVLTVGREARFMTWGFPNLMAGERPHINARSESAAAVKTFRESMAERRCLVPASGYYEWKKTAAKRKIKYEFTLPDRTPLYMAGIYSPDGRFAILTRAAAPAIFEIHDRMPVILPKELLNVWLEETPEVMRDALTDLCFEPVPLKASHSEQLSLFG
jgi:putative SOS response-associated peptidase YedK